MVYQGPFKGVWSSLKGAWGWIKGMSRVDINVGAIMYNHPEVER